MKKGLILSIIIIVILVTAHMVIYSGIRFFTVTGTSMSPSITDNDIIIVYPINIKYLNIGDIISYRHNINGKDYIFTHRIVKIDGNTINTKGDSIYIDDTYNITSDNIIGIMIGKVPYAGYVIRVVSSEIGYIIFIFIPAIILIVKEIKKIVKEIKSV